MLKFENVTKLYGTVIGVNDISLTLEPGAYGLLGPNGSGKTTLINLIIGQLRPTIGRVSVFGSNPWFDQSMLSRIGYCPAIEPIYPNVSGLEWTAYLVQLHGFNRREAVERAGRALKIVGMEKDMRRKMGGYSLGMRQRCKMAQAMAHDPELLILDEPFNGLDPVGRFEMTGYLQDWVDSGRSLILASHILHEVEAVNPSLLLISGGRLLASGSPSEVRSILADCPHAISIRSSDNRKLASIIAEVENVENILFEREFEELVVTTASPIRLMDELADIAGANKIEIHEIRQADESLQDIFSILMRMHRGENSQEFRNKNRKTESTTQGIESHS